MVQYRGIACFKNQSPQPYFLIFMYSFRILFIVSLLYLGCKTERPKEFQQNYSAPVSSKFTGDLAYETTAFVEQYWRVVGNTGFNKSIYKIEEQLKKVGFVNEANAKPNDLFTYRIEKRPLERPTWEPVNAVVKINNDEFPLLEFASNRNMIVLNSFSTPEEGVLAEVIYVEDIKALKDLDVHGKIVFAETSPAQLMRNGVLGAGALGIVTYNNPDYLQPEKNRTSIQFRSIPYDEDQKPWAIALSYEAKERLKTKLAQGKVELFVNIQTNSYPSEELTIIADIKGATRPEERLVFSAHVQEPGANDNASGVGLALEMASLTAQLITNNQLKLDRTLTFLWGDEIVSTGRYVKEDSIRAKSIKWGISLDMVGENTEITGATFLIEKMPDPSAIWTRGKDQHTEWGGKVLTLADMQPHYLNDFLISQFEAQGKRANWKVSTNPYEGGSDHVPFLRNNIPSVLFWHFTDQFYHTDNDRLDKVSKSTLKNVGTAALISAYTLLNGNENTAKNIIKILEAAALSRLNEELLHSQIAIENGATINSQIEIIKAWEDWYLKAIETTKDIVVDEALIKEQITESKRGIQTLSDNIIEKLKN
ncbi:Zn-dependent M28 family amino/carboxypeptidase [Flavobacteriaceae bacterium MAR_2010_72]|nr:Zn-dependent M28 family amino/carboxypeptidase [Flavobacteriaceae bacterium MAR_2010_72]